MKIIKFTLSGRTAFFKKPDVNTYYYFTYGHIHKVALLGMFGAILGYSGYQAYQRKGKKVEKLTQSYPEFYERLQDVRISIAPQNKKGFIAKKIQSFNNSVGYASKEQGGNLIVKEQWLENPKWNIYFQVDSPETKLLADAIINGQCVYTPYLGKNDHLANIDDVMSYEAEGDSLEGALDSLVIKDQIEYLPFDEDNDFGETDQFKYEESLPYRLDAYTNNYILGTFVYTDLLLKVQEKAVFQLDGKKLMFY